MVQGIMQNKRVRLLLTKGLSGSFVGVMSSAVSFEENEYFVFCVPFSIILDHIHDGV